MKYALLLVALGCGSSSPPAGPAPVRPGVVADAAPPAVTADAPEEPVGAVPLPTERSAPPPLDEIDTTVTLAALPAASAPWRTRKSVAHSGRVLIALNVAGPTLELSLVSTEVNETGYPSPLESFPLGPADETGPGDDGGDAFTPYHLLHPGKGDERAPLKFAVRLLPREGAPESERKQVAVYTIGTSVYVADKLLTATTWTPRLKLAIPRATEIVAVNPGWH